MPSRSDAEGRRATLYAVLGFSQLPDSAAVRDVQAFKVWLSTWSGIGHIVTGMERKRFVISLRQLVDDGWTCSFHTSHILAADGIGAAPTPFEAVQMAAWRALNPQRVPTPGEMTTLAIDVVWQIRRRTTLRGRLGRRIRTFVITPPVYITFDVLLVRGRDLRAKAAS